MAVVGFAIIAAATLPFCYADPKTGSWLLALWLLVRGIGLGAVTISVTAVAYLGLDRPRPPHARATDPQQIGGSFAPRPPGSRAALTAHRGNPHRRPSTSRALVVGSASVALAAALSLWLPRRPRPASPLAPASGSVNGTTVSGAARS